MLQYILVQVGASVNLRKKTTKSVIKKKNGIHSMQGSTFTIGHGVTINESTKELKHT